MRARFHLLDTVCIILSALKKVQHSDNSKLYITLMKSKGRLVNAMIPGFCGLLLEIL